MFEDASIAIMYAVTPCHAGSGSALGVVDLPIQRERHTNWPMIQASGVKGAFRANFDRFAQNNLTSEKIGKNQRKDFELLTQRIFGTDSYSYHDENDRDGNGKPIKKLENGGESFAGSCSISDARILAYPMRSNVSPFVWITCPSVLKRFARDLEIAGKLKENQSVDFPKLKESKAVVLAGSITGDVLLEDFEVKVSESSISLPEEIEGCLEDAERLILVSDDVFNYGVTDCTQIMAQIKINSETGTTADGSLRYQEELPSDTIMYTVIHWGDSKNTFEDNLKADTIKKFITDEVIKNHIQIAGDETCGRGIFQLTWYPKKEGENDYADKTTETGEICVGKNT